MNNKNDLIFLNNIISSLKKTYSFVNMTDNEWNAFFINKYQEHINALKYSSNFMHDYKVLFEQDIDKYILLNSKDNYNIINEYINKYLTVSKNYQSCALEFNKLIMFMNKIGLLNDLDGDNLFDLISNNNIIKGIMGVINDSPINDEYNNNYSLFFDAYISSTEEIVLDDNSIANYESNSALYFKSLIPYKNVLSDEEERELAKRKDAGDQIAREKLICHNLLLVVSNAKRFIGRGLEFDDLIQDGTIGLFTAVDKFDYRKGNKLSTYATYWIRSSMKRAISKSGRSIRLPDKIYDKVINYKTAIKKLSNSLNHEPSKEEIMHYMNINDSQYCELVKNSESISSLNSIIHNNSDEVGDEIGDFIVDKNANVEDIVIESILNKDIWSLLDCGKLSDNEKDVLKFRYGYYGNKTYTHREIGEFLNLSRPRIRQIECRALVKLGKSQKVQRFGKSLNLINTKSK